MPDQRSARKVALQKIYAHYEKWAGEFSFACKKGCATCCTQSVTMTTLEGERICEYVSVERPDLLPLLKNLPGKSPSPATTTNRFARACLQGENLADEEPCRDMQPCVFLRQNCCTIYPVRPFMCRSFGSRVSCEVTGCADIAPLFLTLNTMVMQCIEHLDRGRPWGNLNTILRSVAETGRALTEKENTLFSEPLPGFLIPSEEQELLREHLHTLLNILRDT